MGARVLYLVMVLGVGVKYNLLSERGYFIWRMRIETGIFVNF